MLIKYRPSSYSPSYPQLRTKPSSKALRKSNSDMLLKFRRKISVVKQTKTKNILRRERDSIKIISIY